MKLYLFYVAFTLVGWAVSFRLFAYLIWRYGETGDRIKNPAFSSAIGLLMDFLVVQAALSHLTYRDLTRIGIDADWVGLLNQIVFSLFLVVNGYLRARALHKRGELFPEVES